MKSSIQGVAHVFGDNLDTDQIYPGKYLELAQEEDIKRHAMEGADPDFVKNFKSGDVIVGGTNFGCGSSREHAAMSPRLLGAAAVITRSFARIHETNLKKQGILPLTFVDAADYDKVRETDRISLRGLSGLAPGSVVTAVLHHEDGTEDSFPLRHTLNREQVEWFRAGSALNVLRRSQE